MSSMEVNVDMLEQMDLMDMSDHEALDVFLNSGGEDNSAASPMLGTHSALFIHTQCEGCGWPFYTIRGPFLQLILSLNSFSGSGF